MNSWTQWVVHKKYKQLQKGFNKSMKDKVVFYKEAGVMGEYPEPLWFS